MKLRCKNVGAGRGMIPRRFAYKKRFSAARLWPCRSGALLEIAAVNPRPQFNVSLASYHLMSWQTSLH